MSWIVVLGLLGVAFEPATAVVERPQAVISGWERLPPVEFEPFGPRSYPASGTPGFSQNAQPAYLVAPLDESNESDKPPDQASAPEGEKAAAEAAPGGWVHSGWFRPWRGSFEVGLDGSSGNNNTLNLRVGLDAKRKTEEQVITLDLDYHKSSDHQMETAHRLFFDWRYERPFPRSPWSHFVQGTTTYDEFQPWNVRVSAATGLGYDFIESEQTTLVGRFGGGFSQDIGGPDQQYVPELTYGLDYEHEINKRQKIKASAEYYPDVRAFGDFRVVSKVDWELLLDEEMNLSLKFSATDRYKRPNPGGKPNDVDYSIVLLWKY